MTLSFIFALINAIALHSKYSLAIFLRHSNQLAIFRCEEEAG